MTSQEIETERVRCAADSEDARKRHLAEGHCVCNGNRKLDGERDIDTAELVVVADGS